MSKLAIPVAFSLFLTAQSPLAQAPTGAKVPDPESLTTLPDDQMQGFRSITPAQCRSWLEIIASDAMEGRGTGHPGFEKAARYIAGEFKKIGLKPVGDEGSYFQMVPFVSTGMDAKKSHLALLDPKGTELLQVHPGRGLGGTIREASDREFSFVLVVAEEAGDIDAKKVRGKAVLLVDRAKPGRWGLSSLYFGLRRASPGAVVMVSDKLAKVDPAKGRSVRYVGKGKNLSGRFRRPNRYALSMAAAKSILSRAGIDVDLSDKAKRGTFMPAEDYQLRTRVVVNEKPAFACNVVGMLEGSDPVLKSEIVGIGSHLDHIGIARNGAINNGADDDGSGTTGVLAVARAFSLNPRKPRRSLLFMCFCGEELGLIGSDYYVEHPIFDNNRMVAELQMDMIGRHEESARRKEKAEDNVNSLHLVGSKKLSDAVHEICLDVNRKYIGFSFEYDEEGVFNRSDHRNFARKDIPIAFFFTGFHPQYHRPGDTVDRIDFDKLSRVAKLVYGITWRITEPDARPKVDRTYAEVMKSERRGRRRR